MKELVFKRNTEGKGADRTRKKTKRGKKKNSEDNQKIELYYNNINGLLSKQDSLNDILDMRSPDVVALCETKLHAKSKYEIKGYEVVKSNLKAGKEGILVAVKNGTFNTIEKVYETESRQIATFEIVYPKEKLRITVVHGPKEDSSCDEKDDFYIDLKAEIQRSLDSQCRTVIVGDFNGKLEHNDSKIIDSKGNGKRIKEIVENYELNVLNIQPGTEGRWTRIQKKSGTVCKSEIDYILTDQGTQVGKTIIDEDKLLTPYRTKKQGENKTIVFSDHCSITTALHIVKGTTKHKQPTEKVKRWKLTDEGLEKYQEITQSDLGFGNMSAYEDPFEVWRKKVDNVMHQCFDRKTIRIGNESREIISHKGMKARNVIRDLARRGKIQRELMKEYRMRLIENEAKVNDRRRAQKLKETVDSLSLDEKLSPNAFWKMKKATSKNGQLKLHEVIKQNGDKTSDPEEIKNEVRLEFQHRLRNRQPDENWKGYVDATNLIIEELLKEEYTQSPPFTMEEMEKAIHKMKNGTSPDYYGMHVDVIKRSGNGILKPLLQVMNLIKSRCKIPESWRKVLITMIYKNKGSHCDLEKYRGVFLTVIVSKIFERMLQERMKTPLEGVSLFQAGSRTGKSGADNLFLLRSSIDHCKFMNESLYVTTYDFRQAFDSLWLEDCLLVLQKLGVEKYILKLIHEMNKKAIVQIKTPYGLTTPVDVTDIVKQGGVLGSPLCSATTAEYCEKNKGICLGNATIASLAFVDDIADLSTTFQDAIESHKNALTFASKKKLQLAPEKCYIMLLNNANKTGKVPKLEIDGGVVKEVQSTVYLGDVFNSKGNNDDLMKDRVKRGTTTTVSIQSYLRETSLGCHTLSAHLLLHNSILLPSMIFNSESWSNITDKNMKTITTTQLRYLKKMMGVRQAVSNAFTYLELGVLPIKYEIHRRQISYLHHILNLRDDDPVKQVWRNQTVLPEHKNWWNNIIKLMEKYSIEYNEEEITNMAKDTFKRKIKKAVREKAFNELTLENSTMSRTKNVLYEKLETQKYIQTLNPHTAKTIFKCRSKTLNIKEHMKYKFSDLSCRWCGIKEETLSHIVNCGQEGELINADNVLKEMMLDDLKELASRVEKFLSKIDEL